MPRMSDIPQDYLDRIGETVDDLAQVFEIVGIYGLTAEEASEILGTEVTE